MIGMLLRGINIRAEMSMSSQDMGDLAIGDLVIGTVLNGWIAFDGVYRKATNYTRENLPTTRYAAVVDPLNVSTKFMALIDVGGSQPNPTPVLRTLNIGIGGEGYEPVNVELKPTV
jgi:hypothetical protein